MATNANPRAEYKRYMDDELDWTEIQQLHAATLQMSSMCFEYKKLCVTVVTATTTLWISLVHDPIYHSLFFLILLVVIGFWLADSTAYYYQRSVRRRIMEKMESIAVRNNIKSPGTDIEISIRKSLLNESMALYYSLCSMIVMVWLLYIHFNTFV